MNAGLYFITYVSLLVFGAAVAVRFLRIRRYPLNVRWEIYPIPHEGERSRYGGSKLEETDWWTRAHKPDYGMELKFMFKEMILIKGLWDHNRALWWRSFPFHFGLYLIAVFIALLGLSALMQLAGVNFDLKAGGAAAAFAVVTTAIGLSGLLLCAIGCLELLQARATDPNLRPYTNFSHFFNLLFILTAVLLTLGVWVAGDTTFASLRGYIAGLLTFDRAAPAPGAMAAAAIVAGSLLIAYIPLTHMSHFFVKWFTWHRIRWDDEPNVRGGRIEVMIQKALQYPVSWQGKHIRGDGKRTWADVAVEDYKEQG